MMIADGVTRSAEVDETQMELLVRLLTRHQEELFRFILAMHPHEEDARDILQEASVALCRKIEDYDPVQPFLPWAFGFAYLEVLKFRERNQRGNRLLSIDILERLARQRDGQRTLLDQRIDALDICMKKLSVNDQELIRQRYVQRSGIGELVEQSGASRRTLFRNLDRIRRMLLDCISHRVAKADLP
jgi:RNA polymerase sigma-70 factor (ECF subfamily)